VPGRKKPKMPSWPRNWNAEVPAGYTRAGNIITYYDGGNHAMYGRLLSCIKCGAAVVENEANVIAHDKLHVAITAAIEKSGLSFFSVLGTVTR
jgi:hypothetical protein